MSFTANIPSAYRVAVNAAAALWSARPALVDLLLNRRVERARLMRLAGILGGAMQRAREQGDTSEVANVRQLQQPVMDALSALNDIDAYIDRGIAEAKRRGWISSAEVSDAGLGVAPVVIILAAAVVAGVLVWTYFDRAHARFTAADERIRTQEIEARVAQGLPVEQSGPPPSPTDAITKEAAGIVKTVAIVGAVLAALGFGYTEFTKRQKPQ